MWDCTLTSPHIDDVLTKVDERLLALSIPMSPKARRAKGAPHWDSFGCACTPQELKDHPLTSYTASSRREFKIVAGKLACKLCDDGILRTTRGHDAHFRVTHEGLGLYESFDAKGTQSSAGGRVNPNIPEGRDNHRAKLLKELRKVGVTAKELCGEKYTLSELEAAGYTFKDLHGCGIYSLEELKAANVTKQLKAAELPLKKLVEAGYTLPILRKAGYSCKALKATGSYTLADLKGCGFTLHELADPKGANFALSELKELKRPNSSTDPAFTLQDFMHATPPLFSCKDMKHAGFPLAALKSGYTQGDLKVTHFTTQAELAEDGFPLRELKLAGFTATELRGAGFSHKELTAVGFSKSDIKAIGG